jgi:hypothetical protein
VQQLLAAGADTEAADEKGRKAADYASEVQDVEVRAKMMELLGA